MGQQNGKPPKQFKVRISPYWLHFVFITLGLISSGVLVFHHSEPPSIEFLEKVSKS